MPADLTSAVFEQHVGDEFIVPLAVGDAMPLVLAEVERHPPQLGAPRTDPFSLVFTGPPGAHLVQGTIELQHQHLGPIELFVVPLGPGPDGRHRYEVLFN